MFSFQSPNTKPPPTVTAAIYVDNELDNTDSQHKYWGSGIVTS